MKLGHDLMKQGQVSKWIWLVQVDFVGMCGFVGIFGFSFFGAVLGFIFGGDLGLIFVSFWGSF
jgi:hypothetical protein